MFGLHAPTSTEGVGEGFSGLQLVVGVIILGLPSGNVRGGGVWGGGRGAANNLIEYKSRRRSEA